MKYHRQLLTVLIILFSTQVLLSQVDVTLTLLTDKEVIEIDEPVTFSITANNVRQTAVTGLVIHFDIPATLNYESHVAPVGTVFNPSSGHWQIGSQLTANTESLTFHITLSPNAEGTHFLIGEVNNIDGIEYNSTPQNRDFREDDLVVGCIAVPILLRTDSDSVMLAAPYIADGHQWTKTVNGNTQVVSSNPIFYTKEPGIYNYANTETLCEMKMCCDIIIQAVESCDIDADLDGICSSEDCDDNDPNLPAPIGTTCDDDNAFTINDRIQQDSCTCAGDYIACNTALNVLLEQPVYNDNETPSDVSDDTFTFSATVLGDGTGWITNTLTGTYGETVNFGPFPVDATGVVFEVFDQNNPNCQANVAVNISSCIYLDVCSCCK